MVILQLREDHFPDHSSPKRQKVKLAAQLLSNSVSAAIERLVELCEAKKINLIMPPESLASKDFMKIINDWFDICNSSSASVDTRPTKHAFGYKDSLPEQKHILLCVHKAIENMKVISKKDNLPREGLVPFQRGIMQNITGLLMLYEHLKEQTNGKLQYIMTTRLNH